jgi:hypothetical protein
MSPLTRFAGALLVSAAVVPLAEAQAPPAAKQPPARPQAAPSRPAAPARKAVTPTQNRGVQRRSIVHHYPYPYPSYYNDDRSAGFRNPGGAGRYREYYPAGDRFQNEQERDPVRVATFGTVGPTLADQRAARQIAVMEDSVMQQHIDNYARPYYGFGLGVGYFGGFN